LNRVKYKMLKVDKFEIIVIGGGHAGVEAAAASARRGAETLLISDNYDLIGQMSCNPAIGGLAKGQIVLEIDALGGIMGRATQQAGIQFKTLNKSKGPAVQAPRAQCDRQLYQRTIRQMLEQVGNLTIKQDRVTEIITSKGRISGVKTITGVTYTCEAAVLCAGTFLRGLVHIGDVNFGAGRMGESPVSRLAASLEELGFERGRLKTGTPPRISSSSVDFSLLKRQDGDEPPPFFSFYSCKQPKNLLPCWQTDTNSETHNIIRDNLGRSPLYGTGVIKGTGVRYCPSIEDKVVKFSDQESHTVFLEPEGLATEELYANGIPTSLPTDVQLDMVHSIKGLQNARLTRWGYAIEYDYFQPTQLEPTLETRKLKGLYFSGQINGTTGYEEAGAQGLVAGANAAGAVLNTEQLILSRTEAYIGVLIDELVTKGTKEPFRMFTSRAEYRLRLRYDNAHYRLMPIARKRNLIDEHCWTEFQKEKTEQEELRRQLKENRITPSSDELTRLNKENLDLDISRGLSLWELLKRPEITIDDLLEASLIDKPRINRVADQLGVEAKYEGYIKRQDNKIKKLRRLEEKKIPRHIDYDQLPQLSNEAVEKLKRVQPRTLAQAQNISGIKPTDVQVLMIYLEGKQS